MIKLEQDKLKLWSAVCIISAIPSFYWAVTEAKANIPAMLVGVAIFIVGYTAITSSEFYKKLKQEIFWFAALKWAFRVRVLYSVLSLIAIAILFLHKDVGHHINNMDGIYFLINIADWWLGMWSIIITEFLLGKGSFRTVHYVREDRMPIPDNEFFPTLLTTITQGILLSLLILAVAVIIWCFFRAKNIISPTNK